MSIFLKNAQTNTLQDKTFTWLKVILKQNGNS